MDIQEKKCIQDLSSELLLEILGYLPCNFRLTSVNRVCHRFKDLVDSITITSLDLKVTLSEKEMLKMNKKGLKRHLVHGLLQKFLQRPLGHTHTSWLPRSCKRFCRLFEHLEQHPKMLGKIRSVSLTVQDRSWYASCFQHQRLLRNLPHLEHLTLSPPPAILPRYLVETLNYVPRAVRSLRLDFLPLTTLSYSRDVFEDILNVMNHYLYLSGLRKLRIDGFLSVELPLVSDRSTTIRDLWCVGCRNYGTAATITGLMRSSPGLVRCVFETNACIELRPPHNILSLYDDGLRLHKRTLRQLVIASCDMGYYQMFWGLKPLDTFYQLEKLALTHALLPESSREDYEDLPPNLKELQIEYPFHHYPWIFKSEDHINMFQRRTVPFQPSDDYPSIFDDEDRLEKFRSRTRQMKYRLPYLQRWIFWFQEDPVQMAEKISGIYDPFTLKTLQVLKQAFKEFDISFEWLVAFSFWDTPVGKVLDAEGDVIMEESGDAEGDSVLLGSYQVD